MTDVTITEARYAYRGVTIPIEYHLAATLEFNGVTLSTQNKFVDFKHGVDAALDSAPQSYRYEPKFPKPIQPYHYEPQFSRNIIHQHSPEPDRNYAYRDTHGDTWCFDDATGTWGFGEPHGVFYPAGPWPLLDFEDWPWLRLDTQPDDA